MRHSLLTQFIVTANTWNTGGGFFVLHRSLILVCLLVLYFAVSLLDPLKLVRGFKSLKTFCRSFTGFCYRNRRLDLCSSVMKMWFHLFVCFIYFPSLFSTFIIIIVQINRVQSERVYVSLESVLTATRINTPHHAVSCAMCRTVPYRSIR